MNLDFATKKLGRQLGSSVELQKAFGQLSKTIQMRLGVLRNAPTLADVPITVPERCHPLKGNKAGYFAVVLKDNWRLVFKPDHVPVPLTADGGIDLSSVTAIVIENVEDYHGK